MFGTRTRGEQVAALEAKVALLEADKTLLKEKLGLDEATKIVEVVVGLKQEKVALEAQVAKLRQQIAETEQKSAQHGADTEGAIDPTSDPRELMARISGFAEKIKTQNGNIVSLEDQVNSLYAEREILEKELGLSDAQEIISMFRSLDAQLVTMYATRETFERELGVSDASEIVACVRRVSSLARDIEREASFRK